MTPTSDQIRAAVARQAADWFVANQDPAPEYADRAAFVAWLKTSPVHVEEYLGIALVARDLRAAADYPEHSLQSLLEQARDDAAGNIVPGPALQRQQTVRVALPRRWALAAAAAVVVAAVVFWPTVDDGPAELAQTYRTDAGGQMLQSLPDGSAVHLNAGTALVVKYDRDERVVRIDKGQAFFRVGHDDPRRFRVAAGDAEILAVGTRFDVQRTGESIEVTVVEGEVDVRLGALRPTVPVASPAVRRVKAGYGLRIDGEVMPAQSDPVDVHAAVAWLEHMIAFERKPLGEVADELNRYGILQLAIGDPALRALPISGVFNAYDANSFAAFLETLEGLRVERTVNGIRVTTATQVNRGESEARH